MVFLAAVLLILLLILRLPGGGRFLLFKGTTDSAWLRSSNWLDTTTDAPPISLPGGNDSCRFDSTSRSAVVASSCACFELIMDGPGLSVTLSSGVVLTLNGGDSNIQFGQILVPTGAATLYVKGGTLLYGSSQLNVPASGAAGDLVVCVGVVGSPGGVLNMNNTAVQQAVNCTFSVGFREDNVTTCLGTMVVLGSVAHQGAAPNPPVVTVSATGTFKLAGVMDNLPIDNVGGVVYLEGGSVLSEPIPGAFVLNMSGGVLKVGTVARGTATVLGNVEITNAFVYLGDETVPAIIPASLELPVHYQTVLMLGTLNVSGTVTLDGSLLTVIVDGQDASACSAIYCNNLRVVNHPTQLTVFTIGLPGATTTIRGGWHQHTIIYCTGQLATEISGTYTEAGLPLPPCGGAATGAFGPLERVSWTKLYTEQSLILAGMGYTALPGQNPGVTP